MLQPLCQELVGELQDQDEDIEARLPSIMQALSNIGRLMPNIFAAHAATVAAFVLNVRSWQSNSQHCLHARAFVSWASFCHPV